MYNVNIYIYIHTYRQRERERERDKPGQPPDEDLAVPVQAVLVCVFNHIIIIRCTIFNSFF